jgi:hypothetical protein
MGNNKSYDTITVYDITVDYQTFTIEFFGQRVSKAPEAHKWLIGRTLNRVKNWVDSYRGTITKREKRE